MFVQPFVGTHTQAHTKTRLQSLRTVLIGDLHLPPLLAPGLEAASCAVICIHRTDRMKGRPTSRLLYTSLMNVTFSWYLHAIHDAELACQTLSFRLNKAYQLHIIYHAKIYKWPRMAYPKHPLQSQLHFSFIKMLHTVVICIQGSEAQYLYKGNSQSCPSAQVEIALLTRGKISIRNNFFPLPRLSALQSNVDLLS